MYRFVVVAFLAVLASFVPAQAASKPAAVQEGVRVYFSPNGGCADAVIAEVNKAHTTLDIAAYSITHTGIAKAITDASARGVKVRVVMDKTQSMGKYSSATYLANHDIPVKIDVTSGLMHNKYMIVDHQVLITGSFNFTKGAEEINAENLLILTGKSQLVAAYDANFGKLQNESRPYQRAE